MPTLRHLLTASLPSALRRALAAGRDAPWSTTEQVRAELVAHAPEGVAPGKPVWLGLAIEHPPHWHTYWKNPGDSGLPTTLTWQLPAGVARRRHRLADAEAAAGRAAGQLRLRRHAAAAGAADGARPDFSGEALDVKLSAQWLVCKDVCIPQQGEFALKRAGAGQHARAHARAVRRRRGPPQPVDAAQAQASAELVDDAKLLRVAVAGLPPALHGKRAGLLRRRPPASSSMPRTVAGALGRRHLAAPTCRSRRSASRARRACTPCWSRRGQPAGARVELPIAGAWPALAHRAPPVPALDTPRGRRRRRRRPQFGFGAALLFALVGGALLNLMPCVFPVLSLKVLGFAGHAHSRRALVGGGLAYTRRRRAVVRRAGRPAAGAARRRRADRLGLPAAVAAVRRRAGGAVHADRAQPRRPVRVRHLAAERPGRRCALRHPLADSFLTGVLAVAVASPCTAPFMGAALGLAFTLPAAQALRAVRARSAWAWRCRTWS